MATLGRDEEAFCRHHEIPLTVLFDADGMTRSEYKPLMKLENRIAAFGVTHCLHGHDLRSRHGACLLCRPEVLAFLRRNKLSGFVYVAAGANRKILKIGFSKNPLQRLVIANVEGWGGYHDWRLIAQSWSNEAARVEAALQQHFAAETKTLSWIRNGRLVKTREAFTCSLPEVLEQMVLLCNQPPEFTNAM